MEMKRDMAYKTKQREALLSYLAQHADEDLSAQQIAGALAAQDISRSAVYRNLATLEQEGALRRSTRAGSRETVYQYSGSEACRACLHLSCTKCGRTFHMNHLSAEDLIRDVDLAEGFAVDRAETVLYGVCSDCRK